MLLSVIVTTVELLAQRFVEAYMGFAEVSLVFDKVGCLRPGEKLVLVALADRADEHGQAWPSIRELMRRSCQSRRTVMRQLDALRDIGLISSEVRRKIDECGRSRQSTSLYRIDLEGIVSGRFRDEIPSGCQNDTLKEKPRSGPGCQNDTLTPSGCQKRKVQGVTGDTPINNQQNYQPSPQPPKPVEGSVSPPGASPGGGPGEETFLPVEALSLALEAQPQAEEAGVLVGGEVVISPTSVDATNPPRHDRELLAEVLPDGMRAIPPRDIPKVGELNRERLAAGWSEHQIRAGLSSRSLPPNIRHLTGLVISRFRDDLPVDAPPLSP